MAWVEMTPEGKPAPYENYPGGHYGYVPDKIDDWMVTPEGEAWRGDPNNPEHVKAAALSLLRGAGMQPGSYNQGAGIGYSAIDALYASDPRFAQYFPNKQEVYQDIANLMRRQAAIDQAASSQYDFGNTLLGGASAAIGYLSGGFGLQDLISQLGSSGAVAPTVAEYGGAMPGVYSEAAPLVTEGAFPTQVAPSYEEFYQPPTTGEYEGGFPQTETTYTDPLERMYQEGGPVNLPPEIPTGYPQMPPAQFPRSEDMPTETGGISFDDILKGVGKYGPLAGVLGNVLTASGRVSRAAQPYQTAAARAAAAPGAAEALKTGQYLSTLGQQQLTAAQAGELPKGAAGYYDQLRRDAQARILQSAARGGRLDSSTTTQQINQAMTNIENARQQALAMREREAVNNITNAARLMGYSDAGLLRALEMELRGTGAAAQVARDIYGSTMANLPAALRALTGTTAPTTQVASTATATPAG